MIPIELHKLRYDELSEVLIEKVLEIETMYQKMYDNCKHRSGWCKKGDCKKCEYTRQKNENDDCKMHKLYNLNAKR